VFQPPEGCRCRSSRPECGDGLNEARPLKLAQNVANARRMPFARVRDLLDAGEYHLVVDVDLVEHEVVGIRQLEPVYQRLVTGDQAVSQGVVD
jgi:hypothetical protein